MNILRLFLIPFSFLYFIIVLFRFLLYRLKIFKSYKIPVYVISVGNMNTGGSGKTPFCIFLTELFLSQKKKVCIISRGYKRKTTGMYVAFDGYNKQSTEDTGDELMMVINRFCHYENMFFAIADSNRVRAAKYATSKFNPDIIILDDAFQHLSIKRDVDILISDCTHSGFTEKLLLPAGNLREPANFSGRADIRINNFKFSNKSDNSPDHLFSLHATYDAKGFCDKTNTIIPNFDNKNAVVFSGLAKNDSFFKFVRNYTGINVIKTISFPDHHDYSSLDIENLQSFKEHNTIYLTTEKDFIKLNKFTDFLDNFEVYYLKIDLIADKNLLLESINMIKKI